MCHNYEIIIQKFNRDYWIIAYLKLFYIRVPVWMREGYCQKIANKILFLLNHYSRNLKIWV